MKELSLHILDLVQNSITAKATLVELSVIENTKDNILKITIKDNGHGMNKELLSKVISPFTTTRSTRKVGLGISLFKAAAELCNGSFFIDSVEGEGTIIVVTFERNHIDRAPLGNMADTFTVLLLSKENVDFVYNHVFDKNEFTIDTREIKKILGEEITIQDVAVLEWIKAHILESMKEIYNI